MSETNDTSTHNKPRTRMTAIVVVSVIVGALAGGVSGAAVDRLGIEWGWTGSDTSEQAKDGDTKGVSTSVLETNSAINVVEKVNPAVVSIISTKEFQQYRDYPLFGPFSRRVPEGEPQRYQVGGGSGFIIKEDGLILTNKHVVSDTGVEYTVVMDDGTEYAATIVATDPFNDLAFVDIEAEGLPTVDLGDSNSLKVGQDVLAFGNPLGDYSNSVTGGIVSGLNRSISAGNGSQSGASTLENVIQTDAAINPGNSGGPLVDFAGRVVGVNTAIDAEGQSIGFAIPINEAAPVIESVEKYGRIVRPILGVRYAEITPAIAKSEKLPVEKGAWINGGVASSSPAVVPGSAAADAGLQEGDIITEINDQAIDVEHTLAELIQKYAVGDSIKITYLRGDETKTATAVLKEFGVESS